MTDTITLPRAVAAGALHSLDISQALLASAQSIHYTTVLEEYKSLRAALAQQAEQVQDFEAVYAVALRDSRTGTLKDIARLCFESASNVAQQAEQVRDPMTLMTDALIMEVAQGWREFDAPGGGNSVVYGACRAVLNKYRDLLAAAPKGGV